MVCGTVTFFLWCGTLGWERVGRQLRESLSNLVKSEGEYTWFNCIMVDNKDFFVWRGKKKENQGCKCYCKLKSRWRFSCLLYCDYKTGTWGIWSDKPMYRGKIKKGGDYGSKKH